MLKDAQGFAHVYMACGYTDLRQGIDGLAGLVLNQFQLDVFDSQSIFLFCGRRSDRIKALVYEGHSFVLLYKRLANGRFQWPRRLEDVAELSSDQYKSLMDGFEVIKKQTIQSVTPGIF